MLWEVEIDSKGTDLERQRVAAEYDLLTHGRRGTEIFLRSARGFLLEGDLTRAAADHLMVELLHDPLAATARLHAITDRAADTHADAVTVLLKPGVMDPVAQSILDVA